MGTSDFIPGVWGDVITKYASQVRVSWELLNAHSRRGHSENEQTTKEWDRLRSERRRRFNEWRKLTDELLAERVLGHDACYECAGELILNKDRPSKWVWDETPEEHRARIEGTDV